MMENIIAEIHEEEKGRSIVDSGRKGETT